MESVRSESDQIFSQWLVNNLTFSLRTLPNLCKNLDPQDVVRLEDELSPLFPMLKEAGSVARKNLAWEEEYEYICRKTQIGSTSDFSDVKLPFYVEDSTSGDVIKVSSICKEAHTRYGTEHLYKLEIENPQDYYISGIECECDETTGSLDPIDPFSCDFNLRYNELCVNVITSDTVKVMQRVLGVKESEIPFTMVKGGIPCPLDNTVSVEVRNCDKPSDLKITYLLKKMKTSMIKPFLIHQFQDMQPVILDDTKTLETRFSHSISHILVHSEPFYDGPIEAIFKFDVDRPPSGYIENPPQKRRVLSLPEHKSYRFGNWRVFPLREFQSSRLNQYPKGLIELYFSHLENKTRIMVSAISTNICVIKNGTLTHPSL
jgi:hypothetical protein